MLLFGIMEKKQKIAWKKTEEVFFTQKSEEPNEGFFTLNNKILVCTLVGILILLYVTFKAEISLPSGEEGKVLAIVNGVEITEEQLQEEINKLPSYYLTAGVDQEYLRTAILEQLIAKELLLEEVTSKAIFVTEEEVSEAFENLTTQAQITLEQLEERLASEGMTIDELKELVKEQLAVNKLIEQEVIVNVQITEEEILTYYEETVQEMVKVEASHILVCYQGALRCEQNRTKEEAFTLAWGILRQITAGADFGDLATQYSDDPSAQFNEGGLGWFSTGQMVPAFETAAFSLHSGEIVAEPVETDYGYHLIMVTDRKETLEDFKEEIITTLTLEKQRTAVEAYLALLKDTASIEYAE